MVGSVAIVGGGFSGAMLAARLAEHDFRSTVIDSTGVFGRGVAYSTAFDGHLLNVRSGRMSAIEGDPDHFVRWLRDHRPEMADPDGFAPRRLFGDYVQDRLAEVETVHPGRIQQVQGRVTRLEPGRVHLDDGSAIVADAIVIATGNPAPRIAGDGLSDRIVSDPWHAGALDRIDPDDDILIIGSGLTMVDMVLLLEARGWRGRVTAVSRRGLVPRGHGLKPDRPAPAHPRLLAGPLSNRLAVARRVAERHGWRSLMESLRPLTAEAWRAAEPPLRARVVRHLRPWWDVHRHRVAVAIAEGLDALFATGRLTVLAGHVLDVRGDGDCVRVAWRPRRDERMATLEAAWLIDCSGPGHDPVRDPLTGPLLASGQAVLDPLGLGLELDDRGRVLDATGQANPDLFVLGPPARAAFWETIAVPDIRKRIEDVVEALVEPL